MIPKRQTDLLLHGTFFSLVVIYLANLVGADDSARRRVSAGQLAGVRASVSAKTRRILRSGFATGPAGVPRTVVNSPGNRQFAAKRYFNVKHFSALALTVVVAALAGCGSPLPPIPSTPTAAIRSPADARALLDACLEAHGGVGAYTRLHDVNVRFSSHWAALGPKLQPKLSDTGYRQGSDEWYLAMPNGWTVDQTHRGPKGVKHVLRVPPDMVAVNYSGSSAPSTDPEVNSAASLVTDAYSMFLFGPDFFRRRARKVTASHRDR